MSLDVYLEADNPVPVSSGTGIFIRDDGQNREVTWEEWHEMYPGREPLVVERPEESTTVYSANITHNLNEMAGKAGIYEHLWLPDEIGIETAEQLIEPLQQGLNALRSNPDYYKMFNPENGWGDYEGLIRFVANYLTACVENPAARVSVSR